MALVDASEVRIILDTDLSDNEVSAFIDIADSLVSTHLTSTNLSDAVKKEIERWLTAHLITISRDRLASSEKVGDASIQYADAKMLGKGLDATSYGQMVKILDTSHTFEKIDKKEIIIKAVESTFDE